MRLRNFLLYLVLAWGVPVILVLIATTFTPQPGKARSEFRSAQFKPARVWVESKTERRGADYFELRIASPEGEIYFHRDPEPEPIAELESRFPDDAEVIVLYAPGIEGNVIMEIAPAGGPPSPQILSFESVMAEYSSRRRTIYIVAGVWYVLANLFACGLWKVDPRRPDADGNSP